MSKRLYIVDDEASESDVEEERAVLKKRCVKDLELGVRLEDDVDDDLDASSHGSVIVSDNEEEFNSIPPLPISREPSVTDVATLKQHLLKMLSRSGRTLLESEALKEKVVPVVQRSRSSRRLVPEQPNAVNLPV